MDSGGNSSAAALPAGANGATTNPGAAAGGQAVISPNTGPAPANGGQPAAFGSQPGDVLPGNSGRFITGTPSSVPPAV